MNILSRQKHQKVLGELDLKIRDTNIQNVKETKYLGLQIDRHLTWKKHVDTISRKVSRALGVLKYAKSFTTEHLEELVYKHNSYMYKYKMFRSASSSISVTSF